MDLWTGSAAVVAEPVGIIVLAATVGTEDTGPGLLLNDLLGRGELGLLPGEQGLPLKALRLLLPLLPVVGAEDHLRHGLLLRDGRDIGRVLEHELPLLFTELAVVRTEDHLRHRFLRREVGYVVGVGFRLLQLLLPLLPVVGAEDDLGH